jgi:hypothetical protein
MSIEYISAFVRLFLLFICIFVCNKITETLRPKKYGVYRMVRLTLKVR